MGDWRWSRAEWRTAKIYEALLEAAAAGTPCPPNSELRALAGYQTNAACSGALHNLSVKGLIRITGKRHRRIIEIVATGERTTLRCEYVVPPIIQSAATIWGVRASDIYGPARFQRFTRPRMAACTVSVEAGLAYAEVGGFLGSDHTTIIHAQRKAAILAERDPDYREKLAMLRRSHLPQSERSVA